MFKTDPMNKTNLILAFLTLNMQALSAQNASQGFEESAGDNWNYTTNIPFYALNSGNSDLWSVYSKANGRIDKAYAGPTYLAGRDLDNPHSQDVTGVASPEHILTFDPIALGGASTEVSFRLNYVLLDKNDYIYYEAVYDNGSSWTDPEVYVDVFRTTQDGKLSSNDWIEIKHSVPTGKDFVRLRLVIYQNGNGYIGLDNFQILVFPLSTSSNLIEGFAFGPNPTQGTLNLKAKVILDKATVFDVLGKEIITQKGNSNEMSLDLSYLSNGVYFTKVESKGIIQTIRIVKK